MSRKKVYPGILLSLAVFVIGLFWAFVTPIFEFPDEQAHIGTVEFLVKNGRVPVGEEYDMTPEMQTTQKLLGVYRDPYGVNLVTYHPEYRPAYSTTLIGLHEEEIQSLNSEEGRGSYIWKEAARYPRLYYDFVGLADRLVFNQDIFTRTFVMRMINILLFVATIITVYLTGLLIFHKKYLSLTLSTMVLLQPMYSFLSSGINSDNLHNFLVAALIYLGLYNLKYAPTLASSAISLLVLFADLLTKPQGFIVAPILALSYLPWLLKQKFSRLTLFILFLYSLIAIIYTQPLWSPYISLLNSPNTHDASLFEFVRFSLNKLITQNIVWYWGVFKWLGVVLPPIYWQLANRLVLISGLGLLLYFYKVIRGRKVVTPPRLTIYLLTSTFLYMFAIYWFDWQYHKSQGYSIGVQARYFFPVIATQMSLLMIGLLSLGWSKVYRRFIACALVIFFLYLQLGGIWRLLTSYYDVSSLSLFITQISQYKPVFAKGNWWYLYLTCYATSLIAIFTLCLSSLRKFTRYMPPRSNPKIRDHHSKLNQ